MKKLISINICVLFVIALMFMGCHVQVKEDEVSAYYEVAHALTYSVLHDKPHSDLMLCKEGAEKLLSTVENPDVFATISEVECYVNKYFGVDPEHQFYMDNAIRLLDNLIDVNITIPDEERIKCVKAFLNGILEGIEYVQTRPVI